MTEDELTKQKEEYEQEGRELDKALEEKKVEKAAAAKETEEAEKAAKEARENEEEVQ